jgi:OOP family OmpA-OmpF porin
MFNNKFGLKLDFGYNSFKEGDNSPEFDTKYFRADLQGVVNIGRVLNFEDWTNTIGLLAHGGAGIYRMSFDENINDEKDMGVNIVAGLTLQAKLSNRIVLTGDVTAIGNMLQNSNFDGASPKTLGSTFVDGAIVNASIGFTFYLGSAEEHADWVSELKKDELAALEERIGSIETQMNDTDKDGVPDYLDAEPNSITGVAVDSKGRTIDHNGNGVPDELESYIDAKNNEVKNSVSSTGTDIVSLINGGYVNVYFDFNQDMPNEQSVSGINFLIKYLKDNPSASADVIGYADEIGDTAYNKDLSQRRAQNVKQILVDSGIDASRMNIVGNGEDTSVNKDSKQARQVVRRVTFVIK